MIDKILIVIEINFSYLISALENFVRRGEYDFLFIFKSFW